MIRLLLLITFLLQTSLLFAQSDFVAIDKTSETTPRSLKEYTEISEYLTKNLSTDIEKARALYIWIAHNIKYDLTIVQSNRQYESAQEIVEEALRKRRGVCQHYSELFLAMSKHVGLQTYRIEGYTRNIYDQISNLGHAWNGIKIDSNYYFIDVTWASGYRMSNKYFHEFRDKYFLISPNTFIADHMPFDPIWQFLSNPINHKEFNSKNFSKLSAKRKFYFADSIKAYYQQNATERLQNSNRRIAQCGIVNDLLKRQVDQNKQHIATNQYNNAINSLNRAVKLYNTYVGYKNKQFSHPTVTKREVTELIDNAEDAILLSVKTFSKIQSDNKKYQQHIRGSKNQAQSILSAISKEKQFLSSYFN